MQYVRFWSEIKGSARRRTQGADSVLCIRPGWFIIRHSKAIAFSAKQRLRLSIMVQASLADSVFGLCVLQLNWNRNGRKQAVHRQKIWSDVTNSLPLQHNSRWIWNGIWYCRLRSRNLSKALIPAHARNCAMLIHIGNGLSGTCQICQETGRDRFLRTAGVRGQRDTGYPICRGQRQHQSGDKRYPAERLCKEKHQGLRQGNNKGY